MPWTRLYRATAVALAAAAAAAVLWPRDAAAPLWIVAPAAGATLVLTALVLALCAHRRPTVRHVHVAFDRAIAWIDNARARAEECGFAIADDEGLRIALRARTPWRQRLTLEVRDGRGLVRHTFDDALTGDPAQRAWAADLVTFVAGDVTSAPAAPRRISAASVSAATGAIIAATLSSAPWSIAVGSAALLAFSVDALRRRRGWPLALGALAVAALTLVPPGESAERIDYPTAAGAVERVIAAPRVRSAFTTDGRGVVVDGHRAHVRTPGAPEATIPLPEGASVSVAWDDRERAVYVGVFAGDTLVTTYVVRAGRVIAIRG